MHRRTLSIATIVSILALMLGIGGAALADAPDRSVVGRFELPFSENGDFNGDYPKTIEESTRYPTAVSAALLPHSGLLAYWNGLQSLETAKYPLPLDATGVDPQNSQSRVLPLVQIAPAASTSPSLPSTNDGGSDDLFCADQRILLDGSVLAAGGTEWNYGPLDAARGDLSPVNDALAPTGQRGPHGTTELFGSAAARILNKNGTGWQVIDSMHRGRWYPALLTLPNGKLFVVGGVGRLLYNAPVNQNQDGSTASGTNVEQSETFNPYDSLGNYSPATGTWSLNGDATTFPLFARVHLLPSGKVLYDGVGQMWGPFGQGYDEALWNVMKTWDGSQWEDLGIGSYGALSGAVSALLPIAYDEGAGDYSQEVNILHAGGVLGTSPGTGLAQKLAEVVTIHADGSMSAAANDSDHQLNNARWYSSYVLGPDGKVYIFSGANQDEVLNAGQERAIRQAEVYDPGSNTFTPLDVATRDRTYHNSAVLLPDGRMLIGGHSPINNQYGPGSDDASSEHAATGQVEAATGLPVGTANNLKDPSFQIFTPPYLLKADGTPKVRPDISGISGILEWGTERQVALNGSNSADNNIARVTLVHAPATTHTTDADARAIELKITQGDSTTNNVKVRIPGSTVTPPGFYYLTAINTKGVPSESAIVRIGNSTVFAGAGSFTPPLKVKTPVSDSSARAAAPASPVVSEPAGRSAATRGTSSRSVLPALLAASLVSLLSAAGVRRLSRSAAR